MLSKRRAPLTRKEKSFFLLTPLLCGGVVVFALISATPQVKIDEPAPLPLANAHSFYAPTQKALGIPVAPIDSSLDSYSYERTIEEKAWLYSLTRRKAWLKANANIEFSIQRGLILPYRMPLKNWADYDGGQNMFSTRAIRAYKIVEARTHLQEGRSDRSLKCALELAEIAAQVTNGGMDQGRAIEAELLEKSIMLTLENLETASAHDLQHAIQN